MTEADYFEFNKFFNLKSAQGRENLKLARARVAVMFFAIIIIALGMMRLSLEFYIFAPLMLVFLIVYEIALPKLYIRALKKSIEKMKKDGKLPFSFDYVIEFHEDRFIETSETEKTEAVYSVIENISVNDGVAIYLHKDVRRAHVVPFSAFESEEQINEFLDFIIAKVFGESKNSIQNT